MNMLHSALFRTPLTKNIVLCSLQLIPRCFYSSSVQALSIRHARLANGIILQRVLSKIPLLGSTSVRCIVSDILDFNTNVQNNVLLYKYESGTMKVLKIFGFLQILGWVYISYCTYHPGFLSIFHKSISLHNYIETYGLQLIFFIWPVIIGSCFTLTVMFYVSRSVKYIILHKGGKYATVVTYNMFEDIKKLTVPVADIHPVTPRKEMRHNIPIQIAGTRFYYMIHGHGQFVNGPLYDYTVGLKHMWK